MSFRPAMAVASAVLIAFGFASALAATPADLRVKPHTFAAGDGTKVDAEWGEFEVPEDRANPNSRRIKLAFVRFKATTATPGAPIVYLAGGPGGSGIEAAKGKRFPLFMALRGVADVIAFDQRGTGGSNSIPFCASPNRPDISTPMTREAMVTYYRGELVRCWSFWKSAGVAIQAYSTAESANDLEDLRNVLGAPKINLWGISYGTHLGLAMLKKYPTSVDRVVFSSVEGLDQTVKLPAETDRYLKHIAALVAADPQARAVYPDLLGTMRRVHAKLDQSPARVTFSPDGKAPPVTMTVTGFSVRLLTAFALIRDPSDVSRLPLAYLAMDAGNFEMVARGLYQVFWRGEPGMRGMQEAMDLASGITSQRLRLVESQARVAILGDATNFPMPHIVGAVPGVDLGDAFRGPFETSVPVMALSGTVDGRTTIVEQRDALKGIRNLTHVIVENGGHNLFEASPEIGAAVVAYFKGQPVPAAIRMSPVKFALPPK